MSKTTSSDTIHTDSSKRLFAMLSMSIGLLLLLIYFQQSDISTLENKIEGRSDRIRKLHDLIETYPQLLSLQHPQQNNPSNVNKDSAQTLTAMFSSTISNMGLDGHVVSLNPSHDTKKKLSKLRCQLKSLSFDNAIHLINRLRNDHPHLQELDIDLQKASHFHFNLTGTWAIRDH
jgi:hypothetical protein